MVCECGFFVFHFRAQCIWASFLLHRSIRLFFHLFFHAQEFWSMKWKHGTKNMIKNIAHTPQLHTTVVDIFYFELINWWHASKLNHATEEPCHHASSHLFVVPFSCSHTSGTQACLRMDEMTFRISGPLTMGGVQCVERCSETFSNNILIRHF